MQYPALPQCSKPDRQLGHARRTTRCHMLKTRYNLLIRLLGDACGLLALGAPLFLVWAHRAIPLELGEPGPSMHIIIATMIMILFGIWSVCETRGAYAVFSRDGVEQFSPWCGRTWIPWAEVEKVDIYLNGWILIRGNQRRQAAFGWYWENRAAMLDMIESKVGAKIQPHRWG